MSILSFRQKVHTSYRASGQQITVRPPTPDAVDSAARRALLVAQGNHLRDTGAALPVGSWVLVSVTLFTPELKPTDHTEAA